MRYMKWSYEDFMLTPSTYVNEIVGMMREEQEEFEMQTLMSQK